MTYYNPYDYNAIGDGITDDTSAFIAMMADANSTGGVISLGLGSFLVDASAINLMHDGLSMIGNGAGNLANRFPSNIAPTQIILKGAGAGIRISGQHCQLHGLRITSENNRAMASYSIASSGVRVEAPDVAGARADKCVIQNVRIDRQPGDAILGVGPITGLGIDNILLFDFGGMGIRLDAGNYAGISRSNPHYPGLVTIKKATIGFGGGHAIAVSNPMSGSQTQMGIRVVIDQLDCFAVAANPQVRYSNHAIWLFGENCEINNSGIGGNSYTEAGGFVGEERGGVYIAGRDNTLANNRYIYTSQPITWGNRAGQPSTGLEVRQSRNVNTTPVTDFVEIEPGCQGLRLSYDRIEGFVNVATPNRDNVKLEFLGSETLVGAKHKASAYGSSRSHNIQHNHAVSLDVIGYSGFATFALIISGDGFQGGLFHCRVGSGAYALKWAGYSKTISGPFGGSGILVGTSGADGNLNISCHIDGKIYIENRTGVTVNVNATLVSTSGASRLAASS